MAHGDERRRDPEVNQPQQHGVDGFERPLARLHLCATRAAFPSGEGGGVEGETTDEKVRRSNNPTWLKASAVGRSYSGQSSPPYRADVVVEGDRDAR